MLDKLGPNWAILKAPSNWFLVAFSVILLMFILHVLFKGSQNGG